VGTVRDALQLPDMRRIELGYGMSITGELAGAVALVVYAVSMGGAALVAAYAAARTVAGMGVVLVLTGITSRLRRDRLLRWITGVRTVLLAAAALLAALGQPAVAVIAAGAASSSLAGTYRPLQAAVLPWLVRTPAELAASNAVTAMMENAGALIGPLLAGGVLAVASPAAAMAVAAGCLAAATVWTAKAACSPWGFRLVSALSLICGLPVPPSAVTGGAGSRYAYCARDPRGREVRGRDPRAAP
jgi:MFS family permease